MESGLDSEHALAPWSLSQGQLVNGGVKGDSFLIELQEDSNRETVTALAAEVLPQLSGPLSMYPFQVPSSIIWQRILESL